MWLARKKREKEQSVLDSLPDTDKLVLDGSKFWVSRTKIGEEKMGVRIEMARSEGSGSGNWRRREVSD